MHIWIADCTSLLRRLFRTGFSIACVASLGVHRVKTTKAHNLDQPRFAMLKNEKQ